MLVVERKVGNSGDQGTLDHIGRVKAAAEPDFEDAGIGRSSCEGEDRRGCCDVEKAGLDSIARIENFGEKRLKSLVIDQAAGDANPLVEADKVRAGEYVDLVPARLERCSEEGDGGAFAIGPGDVEDGGQRVLWPSQPVEDGGDAFKPKPIAC